MVCLDKWENPVLPNKASGVSMKVGDLVKYWAHNGDVSVVLQINEEGSTVKVLLTNCIIGWLVKSVCEVV